MIAKYFIYVILNAKVLIKAALESSNGMSLQNPRLMNALCR